MITLDGKTHIKRYLAGFVPSIARSIAFGLGDKVEANNDVRLQFEVGRTDITLTSYDFVNNKLIFKAPVPDDFGGKVYEVALYSAAANAAAGEYGSRILTTFDSASENWMDSGNVTPSVFTTSNIRVGADGMIQSPAASTVKTDMLQDISLDLSGYSAADLFNFAINVGVTAPTQILVRFMTDASNSYTFSLATAVGYKIVTATKGSASVTGTPDWGNITEIRIATTAAAGGTANVTFDGIRIEDTDTVNSDYVMVSRELLSPVFTKQEGMSQEIEFSLDVNV